MIGFTKALDGEIIIEAITDSQWRKAQPLVKRVAEQAIDFAVAVHRTPSWFAAGSLANQFPSPAEVCRQYGFELHQIAPMALEAVQERAVNVDPRKDPHEFAFTGSPYPSRLEVEAAARVFITGETPQVCGDPRSSNNARLRWLTAKQARRLLGE